MINKKTIISCSQKLLILDGDSHIIFINQAISAKIKQNKITSISGNIVDDNCIAKQLRHIGEKELNARLENKDAAKK